MIVPAKLNLAANYRRYGGMQACFEMTILWLMKHVMDGSVCYAASDDRGGFECQEEASKTDGRHSSILSESSIAIFNTPFPRSGIEFTSFSAYKMKLSAHYMHRSFTGLRLDTPAYPVLWSRKPFRDIIAA